MPPPAPLAPPAQPPAPQGAATTEVVVASTIAFEAADLGSLPSTFDWDFRTAMAYAAHRSWFHVHMLSKTSGSVLVESEVVFVDSLTATVFSEELLCCVSDIFSSSYTLRDMQPKLMELRSFSRPIGSEPGAGGSQSSPPPPATASDDAQDEEGLPWVLVLGVLGTVLIAFAGTAVYLAWRRQTIAVIQLSGRDNATAEENPSSFQRIEDPAS